MVGWHHWLDGHEFEQAAEDGEGPGSLVCCSPWVCKESDTTEQLSNNSHFNGRKQRGAKEPFYEGGRGSEKVGLKLNIQKPRIMVSSPIISRQTDGAKMETVTDFIFLVSKITVDGDCSHEIKRHLLLGREAMTNLDSIFKSRNITLPKVSLIKAMVFPVVMYLCESWTIKKAEHWRINAFELWCWRRCLRVPWTARRSNQSIWNEINPEYSLEGLILKLKVKYFGHLMGRADSLEKTLMLGKTEGRRRGWWGCHHQLDGHEFEQILGDSEGQKFEQILGDSEGQGSLLCYCSWGPKESDTN